jgi:hypothetical protein
VGQAANRVAQLVEVLLGQVRVAAYGGFKSAPEFIHAHVASNLDQEVPGSKLRLRGLGARGGKGRWA